ncbi:hypothetical protein COV82_04080 [Candidatus Peregrinibacteria bacterium CG11_big_fil_rev_8_21_14_0_20_46_8]|nr:MAG: hypothetical protein COV82_04080 [Candidatus Peregrinibacteria bacterium CG11_big_fil_rev_8_21_14_0_20_46_8]
MVWLFAALAAPILWAVTNLTDAALRRHHIQNDLAISWWIGITRLPIALLLLAIGGFEFPNSIAAGAIALSGVFMLLASIVYYRAMNLEEPTRVALLFQIAPIFTFTIAYIFINERLTHYQFLAFIILLAAGLLSAFKKTETRWHFSGALILIAIAELIWSSSDVIFKNFAVNFQNFVSTFGYYMLGNGLAALPFYALPKKIATFRSHIHNMTSRGWIYFWISQITSIVGMLFSALALTLGPASLTAVIFTIQPLFVFFFALLLAPYIYDFPRESFTTSSLAFKGASFALALVGIALLQV